MRQQVLNHTGGTALLRDAHPDRFEHALDLFTPSFALLPRNIGERVVHQLAHLVDALSNTCGARRRERCDKSDYQTSGESRAEYEKQHDNS
jgi:hypothetical protein